MRNGGDGQGHARRNVGSVGDTPASEKPISESRMPKRKHSRGLSTASGVDSNEEDVDATPCVCRRVKRGGVRGAIESAANWLIGRPVGLCELINVRLDGTKTGRFEIRVPLRLRDFQTSRSQASQGVLEQPRRQDWGDHR